MCICIYIYIYTHIVATCVVLDEAVEGPQPLRRPAERLRSVAIAVFGIMLSLLLVVVVVVVVVSSS